MNAVIDQAAQQAGSQTVTLLSLSVTQKTDIASGITLFEFRDPEARALPAFTAGAHIAVTTPNGLVRRYSLCNAPAERDRYQIAVQRDANGTGGSVSLVDSVKVGDRLSVAAPENYFPLVPNAQRYLLIAGGIGITPMLAMLRELQAHQADFELVYVARFPESSAFLDELSAPEFAGRVRIHHSHGDPARALNLEPILAAPTDGTHLYCCGPRRLMQAVRELSSAWPAGTVHFEDFGTSEQPQAGGDQAFTVKLARSNTSVAVPAGVSILKALLDGGVDVPSSCESGTCGACRTKLISGVAEHRDYVLDEEEFETDIMICVSRAKCAELVLDL